MDGFWPAFADLVSSVGLNGELVARYGPRVAAGFIVTCQLVFWSMLFGALIAFPLAFMRMSKKRWLSAFAWGYIYFFRGTPLLAQTFLLYYGVGDLLAAHRDTLEAWGVWWLFREAFYYAVIAFTLNTAAYQAEILRGGIESVPRGQTEAGQAVGLSQTVIFRKIVLPQALIAALRPLGNELILMIKASSVASIITVYDVMGATRLAYARSFDFEAYMWAALIYLVLVESIRRLWDWLEWRMTRHMRPVGG